MSKRLICTERPLAALGREDVMKRVFFLSLCREKPAAGVVLVVGGRIFRGRTCPVDSCSTGSPRLPHPSPQSLRLTAYLERNAIYLVSHKKGSTPHSVYGPDAVLACWGDTALYKNSPRDLPVVRAQPSVGMISRLLIWSSLCAWLFEKGKV